MLVGMRRLLPCLFVLVLATGCARDAEPAKPTAPPELAPLLELAKSPEVELDATDAPRAPRGFNRVDVLTLANALVDAVRRTGTAGPDEIGSARDAADHTFASLDMRSRVRIADLMETTSRDTYAGMPVTWMFVDRWEHGHRPVSPGRIIKAAWSVEDDDGFLDVTLQVVQSYVDPTGAPMFIDRMYSLSSEDPSRGPALQTFLGAAVRVTGIDRCHVVETGRFRPERDVHRLRKSAEYLREDVAADGVRPIGDDDFRRGCD